MDLELRLGLLSPTAVSSEDEISSPLKLLRQPGPQQHSLLPPQQHQGRRSPFSRLKPLQPPAQEQQHALLPQEQGRRSPFSPLKPLQHPGLQQLLPIHQNGMGSAFSPLKPLPPPHGQHQKLVIQDHGMGPHSSLLKSQPPFNAEGSRPVRHHAVGGATKQGPACIPTSEQMQHGLGSQGKQPSSLLAAEQLSPETRSQNRGDTGVQCNEIPQSNKPSKGLEAAFGKAEGLGREIKDGHSLDLTCKDVLCTEENCSKTSDISTEDNGTRGGQGVGQGWRQGNGLLTAGTDEALPRDAGPMSMSPQSEESVGESPVRAQRGEGTTAERSAREGWVGHSGGLFPKVRGQGLVQGSGAHPGLKHVGSADSLHLALGQRTRSWQPQTMAACGLPVPTKGSEQGGAEPGCVRWGFAEIQHDPSGGQMQLNAGEHYHPLGKSEVSGGFPGSGVPMVEAHHSSHQHEGQKDERRTEEKEEEGDKCSQDEMECAVSLFALGRPGKEGCKDGSSLKQAGPGEAANGRMHATGVPPQPQPLPQAIGPLAGSRLISASSFSFSMKEFTPPGGTTLAGKEGAWLAIASSLQSTGLPDLGMRRGKGGEQSPSPSVDYDGKDGAGAVGHASGSPAAPQGGRAPLPQALPIRKRGLGFKVEECDMENVTWGNSGRRVRGRGRGRGRGADGAERKEEQRGAASAQANPPSGVGLPAGSPQLTWTNQNAQSTETPQRCAFQGGELSGSPAHQGRSVEASPGSASKRGGVGGSGSQQGMVYRKGSVHRFGSDGHMWHKYSHKRLRNSHIERSYFSCVEKDITGCQARKLVDRPHDTSTADLDVVTFEKEHNHAPMRTFERDPGLVSPGRDVLKATVGEG